MTIDTTAKCSTDDDDNDASDVFYRLDKSDRIVDVGGNWRPYSEPGSTAPVSVERVIGTNIFEHVSGHFTRLFLRKFIAASRNRGTQTRMLYRCDSPSHKILTEMRAEPGDGGETLISHRTIETAPFPFEISFLPAASYGVSRALRCSMCNRLRPHGSKIWQEPETTATENKPARVVHTVCPDCRKGVKVQPIRSSSGP